MIPNEPSDYQKAIFDAVRSGNDNLVIEARAGSAKTTTAVEAVNFLGTTSVFMTSFGKQIVKQIEAKAPEWVATRTLHSHGFRSVRMEFPGVEVSKGHVEGLIDRVVKDPPDQIKSALVRTVEFAKKALVDINEPYECIDQILEIVDDNWIDIQVESGRIANADERATFAAFVLNVLKLNTIVTDTISFDDQIWLPIVLDLRVLGYDRVFVDEAQDLNPAQVTLALKSVRSGGRIISLGDQMQSIYTWRGADVEGMETFALCSNAKWLSLPICYRCPSRVVSLVRYLVPDMVPAPGAPEGIVKKFWSRDLVDALRPGDLVLSRTNAHAVRICMALLTARVPCQIKGKDLGASLAGFVKHSKCSLVSELLVYVDEWVSSEVERLKDSDRNYNYIDHVYDRRACFQVLCEGLTYTTEVVKRIQKVLGEQDGEKVTISTVHQAKGAEADRVFVLCESFWHLQHEPSRRVSTDPKQKKWDKRREEEERIWYVAVTRAMRELYLVLDDPQMPIPGYDR